MVVYNFHSLPVVPTGANFIDITLSKTQRKTPTEIHKSAHVSTIRKFYMRKVKFTQQTLHDKLSQILSDFPLLDDVHPFYSDLMNVLYDKDHYKLALGQMNNARHLIDNLAKDYVRLLKYGDSLYRCKQLKRAALGRMCTLIKGLSPSLAYLEQVRQHLSRLPSIDPNTRTLIVCGYPNVGKSSFMNKITRANVDVQPYAFTTKSLFVGHTDYKYMTWQVIDTPGILDHPLEERNTIEMQSITALAHLHAAILYFIDISETCGYTIEQQVQLFNSIKPLFVGKPLVIVINKIDMVKPEDLAPERWEIIRALSDPDAGGVPGAQLIRMSNMTDEGVSNVKVKACDALLEARVDKKLKSKKLTNSLHRIHVATPTPRDQKSRPAFIPDTVRETEPERELTKEERAIEQFEEHYREELEEKEIWESGEVPGMNSQWLRERWDLKSEEWKYDVIPEIVNGRNVADYIDPEILQRLEELEREEENRVAMLEEEKANTPVLPEMDDELKDIIRRIRNAKAELSTRRRYKIQEGEVETMSLPKTHQKRTLDQLSDHLTKRGMLPELVEKAISNIRARSSSRSRSRSRSLSRGRSKKRSSSAYSAFDDPSEPEAKKRKREKSRSRSISQAPKANSGMSNAGQVVKAGRLYQSTRKHLASLSKKGEGDRWIPNLRPKHLSAGKRSNGKTDRR